MVKKAMYGAVFAAFLAVLPNMANAVDCYTKYRVTFRNESGMNMMLKVGGSTNAQQFDKGKEIDTYPTQLPISASWAGRNAGDIWKSKSFSSEVSPMECPKNAGKFLHYKLSLQKSGEWLVKTY